MDEPKVVMIALNYNGNSIKFKERSILDLFLTSMLKTNYDNFKLIIFDDCSTDNSESYIEAFNWDKIDFQKSRKNLNHFSKQNNMMITYALEKYNPDYILLLNNDLIFEYRDWLKNLVNAGEQKDVGITGALYYEYGRKPNIKENEINDIDSPLEACYLIKKEVIDKIGVLDEGFLTCSEGTDYDIRVRDAGFRTVMCMNAPIVHLEGSTSFKNSDFERQKLRFYGDRISMMHFMLKNYNKPQVKRKLKTLWLYFASCIMSRYGKDGKLSINTHKFWRIKTSFSVMFNVLIKGTNHA
jgi:GT2 family glycosyltransferase